MGASSSITHDSTFVLQAVELSLQSVVREQGGPFGALIVLDGDVIGRGWNRVTATNDPTAHAEIVAIRAACTVRKSFRLEGATLYASCEPCPMCLAAAYWARVGRIVFAASRSDASQAGFDDEEINRAILTASQHSQIATAQVCRDEALEAFRAWTEKTDKTVY